MKKKDEALERKLKGIPGQYVQNQKMHVFEDRRTRRNRARSEKRRNAIAEQREAA